MRPGRNDPCPCGSGRKFKKCCLGLDRPGSSGTQSRETVNAIEGLIKEHACESLEEAQAVVDNYMRQRNTSPRAEFHGLSSEQMSKILYHPFESPELAKFSDCLPAEPMAPAASLLQLLAEAIGDKGLKPTVTGNLPRAFCRESARIFWGEEEYRHWSRYGELRSEPEFHQLHVTRLVGEMAGLIRKYKGKFILSRKYRSLYARQGTAAIYPLFLKSYITDYNWTYGDAYPEAPFLQGSFLFTLYLLHTHGDRQRTNSFYEDAFLQAFPMVLDEFKSPSYGTPEEAFRRAYSVRCLERFAGFLGLAEISKSEEAPLGDEFTLRKSPLLDQAVVFSITG